MIKQIIPLIVLFSLFNLEILGQENLSKDTSQTSIFQDFKIGINDGVRLLKSPSKFSSEDWIYLGGIAGVTAGSFFIDKSIRNTVAKNRNETMNDIIKIGELYGTAEYILILSGAAYLTGKVLKDNELSGTGRMVLETLTYAGIISTILKVSFGRARPYMNKGAFDFFNFSFTNDDYFSFPSGHSITAFAVSSTLAAKFKNTYASIVLYALAGLTMYQRVYADRHWFSDTFLGAAISTAIGNSIVNFNEEAENNTKSSLVILPSIQGNSMGINLVYSF